MAEVLAKQPLPGGPRLTILTNAGGPGVLATDALISNGGTLAHIAPNTLDALNQLLPTGALNTAYYTQQVPNPMAGLIPSNAALNGTK